MYGHCKNCWWWDGNVCHFQNSEAGAESYCPDYVNREKEEKRSGKLKDL